MLMNLLKKSHFAKTLANETYVYLINMLHLFLNLLPSFVRNGVFRLLLGKAGSLLSIDHNVYFKFPWLVRVGDRVTINRGVEFYPGFFGKNTITIGSDVAIAPNVRFHAAGHEIDPELAYADNGADIVVGDRVWIGAAAILLPGVTVGDNCVIGAGSVVAKDIPANSIAVGVPARVVRQREKR